MSPKPEGEIESCVEDVMENEQSIERPAFHVPNNEEEEFHVEEVHGHDSWQSKVLHVVHSKPVTFTLLALLLLDVIILFAELYLGAEFPSCSIVSRDAISCCPVEAGESAAAAAAGDHGDGHHRWLREMDEITGGHRFYRDAARKWEAIGSDVDEWSRALAEEKMDEGHADDHGDDHGDTHGDDHGDGRSAASAMDAHSSHGDGHHSYCTNGLTDMDPSQYPATCDPHKYEALHTAHVVLFWLTVAILGTFLLELTILIVCLGCTFFTKPFYVLDLFVVTTSLALELTFHFISEDSMSSLAGLLILARLWRFVRIGHGLVEATNEYQSQKHGKLMKYIDELEELCRQNDLPLPDRKSIRKLKLLNDEH